MRAPSRFTDTPRDDAAFRVRRRANNAHISDERAATIIFELDDTHASFLDADIPAIYQPARVTDGRCAAHHRRRSRTNFRARHDDSLDGTPGMNSKIGFRVSSSEVRAVTTARGHTMGRLDYAMTMMRIRLLITHGHYYFARRRPPPMACLSRSGAHANTTRNAGK